MRSPAIWPVRLCQRIQASVIHKGVARLKQSDRRVSLGTPPHPALRNLDSNYAIYALNSALWTLHFPLLPHHVQAKWHESVEAVTNSMLASSHGSHTSFLTTGQAKSDDQADQPGDLSGIPVVPACQRNGDLGHSRSLLFSGRALVDLTRVNRVREYSPFLGSTVSTPSPEQVRTPEHMSASALTRSWLAKSESESDRPLRLRDPTVRLSVRSHYLINQIIDHQKIRSKSRGLSAWTLTTNAHCAQIDEPQQRSLKQSHKQYHATHVFLCASKCGCTKAVNATSDGTAVKLDAITCAGTNIILKWPRISSRIHCINNNKRIKTAISIADRWYEKKRARL